MPQRKGWKGAEHALLSEAADVRSANKIRALSAALEAALDEYETAKGRLNPKYYPNHWTVKARDALK